MCIPFNWGPNNSDYYPKEEKEKDRDKRCIKCGHRVFYKGLNEAPCMNEHCENYPKIVVEQPEEKKEDDEIEEIELS